MQVYIQVLYIYWKNIVELIMQIEKEFKLEIPDTAAEKIVTIGDVVTYIQSHKE